MQRLFLCNLELAKNNKSLDSYALTDKSVIYVSLKPNTDPAAPQTLIRVYETFADLSVNFEELLQGIRQGLASGFVPRLTDSGTSGTYLLQNHLGHNIVLYIYLYIDFNVIMKSLVLLTFMEYVALFKFIYIFSCFLFIL